MPKITFKNLLTSVFLIFLTIFAFQTRLHFFKESRARTIDEIVYYRIGQQIQNDLSQYNTIPYGQDLAATGRKLPAYFFAPLFKHPPVYPIFVASSLKVFGNTINSAGYVSILFGALIIILTYYLGSLIYSQKVGFWAAVFMSLDPVTIICSQKVWMDTTLSYLMLLSLVLFVQAIKYKNDNLFILSGLVSGLATCTKYTGFLITIAYVIYATVYQTELLRKKRFLLGLLMPFICLAPWIAWNINVYGLNFINTQGHLHSNRFFRSLPVIIFFATFLLSTMMILWLKARDNLKAVSQAPFQLSQRTVWIISALFFLTLVPQLINALNLVYLPKVTWMQKVFSNAPFNFYFGKLLEFSLLYIFAFVAFFLFLGKNDKQQALAFVPAFIILLFFVVWRHYQSRYILPAIPLLVISAIDLILKIFERISRIEDFLPRVMAKTIMLLILTNIIVKNYLINMYVSFPNDMAYF